MNSNSNVKQLAVPCIGRPFLKYLAPAMAQAGSKCKIANPFVLPSGTEQPESILLIVNSALRRRYVVAFLGFLCAIVMHSQRLNISIAMVAMVNSTSSISSRVTVNGTADCPSGLYNATYAKPSRGKFFWSPELQGYILSAGFLGYVLTQIPGGILAGRFGTKKILVPGLLIAAACNLLSPLAANEHPYFLLVLTLIRGMAQGMKQPALSVLMSKWFARSERGFLSAFIYCGYPVGAFITCISGGRLCDLEFLGGWPLVFYTFGLWGVFVALLFLIFYYDRPEDDPRITEAELKHIQNLQEMNAVSARPPTPWLAMVKSVPFYALVLALFGQYWMAFYFVSVHPIYLGTVLHIPIRQNGTLSSGPHIVQAIAGWCTCYLSYWLSRHSKIRVETVRKSVNSLSCIVFSIGLVGVFLAKCNITLNEIFLYIATGSVGFAFAGALITSVDMSPTFCGPLMGFASTLGSFAGFFVPVTVGNLTNEGQNLTQWGKIFLISTGISIGCGLVFQFLGSAEVQPWDPVYPRSRSGSRKEEETQQNKSTDASCRL